MGKVFYQVGLILKLLILDQGVSGSNPDTSPIFPSQPSFSSKQSNAHSDVCL